MERPLMSTHYVVLCSYEPAATFADMTRILLAAILLSFSTEACAQIQMSLEAEKEGFRNGVQWVRRTWYNPINGTTEPDMSTVPNIYLRPNQLIEWSKEGKLKSVTEFVGGTDDKSLSTERYIWKDGRLIRKTHENADYELLYATSYTYDADGHEIKAETMPGPGDKMGFFAGMASTDESTWSGGRLTTMTTRGRDAIIKKVRLTLMMLPDEKHEKNTRQLVSMPLAPSTTTRKAI
jgi:hypothetical protein